MPRPGESRSPHRRLHAHHVAAELAVACRELASTLGAGHGDLRDQLRRSSHAVVRNIAEGAGRWSPADKIARFVIAQGELCECDATLETILRMRMAADDHVQSLIILTDRLGALSTGLIHRQQRRAQEEREVD